MLMEPRYTLLYMDDFGIAATNKTLTNEVIACIKIIYQRVKGDLDFYLGMKVVSNRVKRTITTSHPG